VNAHGEAALEGVRELLLDHLASNMLQLWGDDSP